MVVCGILCVLSLCRKVRCVLCVVVVFVMMCWLVRNRCGLIKKLVVSLLV